MPWIRIDDHAPEHPKQLRAGPEACWLWVCSLAYASRYLTDGFVPQECVPNLGAKHATQGTARLLESGLWEQAIGGYQIHDYLKYNPSRLQVLAKREKTATRVATWKQQHGNVGSNGVTNAPINAVSCPAPVPVPVPVPQETKNTVPADAGFAEFWALYPKHEAKHAALKVWTKLRPDAALQTAICASVKRWAASEKWTKEAGQFVPMPATWLNQRRWEDELPGVPTKALNIPPADFTKVCKECEEPFRPNRNKDGTCWENVICNSCASRYQAGERQTANGRYFMGRG